MKIEFTLNGKTVSYNVSSDMPLSHLLLDYAGITTIKPGCGKGYCGNCIVLMNNTPVMACLVPVFRVRGQEVVTFERFQRTRDFTDIRKGFEEVGAAPCEYCFPTKVLLTHGLISRNVRPEPEDILQAFTLHECSCVEPDILVQGVLKAGMYRGRRRSYAKRK